MVGFGNAASLVLVWCLSLGFIGCAVLRDEVQFEARDVLDQKRVRSKSKVQPGEFLLQMEEIEALAHDLHEDGYQADQAGWSMVQDAPKSFAGAAVPVSHEVRKIFETPRVECAEDAMSLKLHGAPFAYESGLFFDQDAGPPLPLSKVPSGCGVQVHRRWWGLILTVPFVGCFGAQESDSYTLPIHLSGLPAKLSCPLTHPESKPISVLCNSTGMIVKTPKATYVDHLWVKVEKEWLPVLKAAVRCNFSVLAESDGLVLSSPYKPCMVLKDGVYSIHIAVEKEIKLFCPATPPTSPNMFAPPPSAPSPTVHANTVALSGLRDMSFPLRPAPGAFLDVARLVLPATSLPPGPSPVANFFDSSSSNSQPTNLTLGPALNLTAASFGSNLASSPPTTNLTSKPAPALNLPNVFSGSRLAANPMIPTTSLPPKPGPVASMPNASNPVLATPTLTPGPAPTLPGVTNNSFRATSQPIVATTGSPGSNWLNNPVNLGWATTSIPPVDEKPLYSYSANPWYSVYPLPKPIDGHHERPRLPETSFTSDSLHTPALSFPGPVPHYYVNPFMHHNHHPMSGTNYDHRPYWNNQPYYPHGHQYPYSYPMFSPNMANPNLPVPSCKDKRSCGLQNHGRPYFPSNNGGYNHHSPPVDGYMQGDEGKSVTQRSKPLKVMKSRLF